MPLVQEPKVVSVCDLNIDCEEKRKRNPPEKRWDDCHVEELCQMIKDFNAIPEEDIKKVPSPAKPGHPDFKKYQGALEDFGNNFTDAVQNGTKDEDWIKSQFSTECRYNKWNEGSTGPPPVPARQVPIPRRGPSGMNPDHAHDVGLNGPVADLKGMKWVNSYVNKSNGKAMGLHYKPGDTVTAPKCCPT